MAVRLGKLVLKNPLISASGTFGLGDKHQSLYRHAGAFICKTITARPRPGHPPPRLVETPSGTVNFVGLENPGVDRFLESVRGVRFPTAFIASVYAERPAEMTALLEKMESSRKISGYELNLSCPNVRQRRVMPSVDLRFVRDMVRAARRSSRKWMCAKLPPYSCVEAAVVCEEHGADAVTVCNTYPAIAFTPGGLRLQGGLAGPAVKPMSLYNVFYTSDRVRIPVIASGGVRSGRDVQEFLSLGAKAVQVGSIQYVYPDAIRRILHEWRSLEK